MEALIKFAQAAVIQDKNLYKKHECLCNKSHLSISCASLD